MAKILSVVALLLAVVALAINFVVPGPAGVAGAPGADGADGADGVDGVDGLNGADGADGADGATGPAGPTGPAGADGINCWDLNQNGLPDVATEDLNFDTVVDVRDCTGPQGPAGGVILVSANGLGIMAMVGCTNYMSISITVPGPGTILVTSMVHLWVQHTAGTPDAWWFYNEDTAGACVDTPPYNWIDEIPADVPTDALINQMGTVVRPFSVAAAGTYTYYVNVEMWQGQSASDRVQAALMVAEFAPS